MIMLSVMFILLSKYSRQEDIIVGSVVSGRNHPSTLNMIGTFVNTLALRGRPEKEKAFSEILNEIREMLFDVYENSEYPFEQLVENINLQRDMSRNPLFDVMFSFQNNEEIIAQFDNAKVLNFIQYQFIAKFDLNVNVEIRKGEYFVQTVYCTDLFKKESVELFLKHFFVILETVLENRNILIKDIPTASEYEIRKITGEFNNTALPYKEDLTVVEKFEEMVDVDPNQIAMILNDEVMAYAELNRRANQIAHFIRAKGIRRNEFVALQITRSFEMFVAIMGVIKSGVAYVPIDPGYPKERKDFIIQDCQAKLMLTYGISYESDEYDTESVRIDDIAEVPEFNNNPPRCNISGDLIYSIFTSGTTGKPKGVLLEHGGVISLQAYLKDTFKVNYGDHILQFANYVFDASVFEYVMAFLMGATLVLVPRDVIDNVEKFNSYVAEKEIDYTLLPPQYYLLSDIKGLKVLTTGGSAASKEVLEKAQNNDRYINLYGPTENTVLAAYWEYREGNYDLIPIGKPIANTKGYILEENKLCGIGIPGELCLAGAGVAQGYLNCEELTKEKFTPNMLGSGNMYHTGDLVRWNSNGEIEFLGRIDEQVKIRGYRIELGEVESALRECSMVIDCAVIARRSVDGQDTLYAYFVSDEKIDSKNIHSQLIKLLPEYMIPSYIMQIEKIPANSSGKIDKRKLPDIDCVVKQDFVSPGNEKEEILCHVFEEILGVKKVGIEDNFFDLGGDSIKSIRIVSRVRELGYSLTTKNIMESLVVSRISLDMKKDESKVYEQFAVTGEVLPLPIVKLFTSWKLPVPGHFNQSNMLRFDYDYEVLLIESMRILANHHDILRAIYKDDRLYIRDVDSPNLFDFQTFYLEDENIGSDRINAICDRLQSEIDIVNGPLVHCGYFVTKSGYYLLICIHHLIVDNVSWHILLEDLNQLLACLKEGREVKLPMKTASYKAWCALFEDFRRNEICKNQENYWKEQEAQIEDGNLKHDEVLSGHGYEKKEVIIDTDLTEKLLYQSNRAYNTENIDLLLSALGTAMKRMNGNEKVSVWLEGHGRQDLHDHIDVDRTVGWFTNCYPVILLNHEELKDQIIATKDILHDVPMKGIGYGAFMNIDEDFKYSTISFNYLGEISSDRNFDVNLAALTGKNIADENGFVAEIVFNGKISDHKLQFDVFYNKKLFSDSTMSRLIHLYESSLKDIIVHCSTQDESIKTKSDIVMTDIANDEFAEILALF